MLSNFKNAEFKLNSTKGYGKSQFRVTRDTVDSLAETRSGSTFRPQNDRTETMSVGRNTKSGRDLLHHKDVFPAQSDLRFHFYNDEARRLKKSVQGKDAFTSPDRYYLREPSQENLQRTQSRERLHARKSSINEDCRTFSQTIDSPQRISNTRANEKQANFTPVKTTKRDQSCVSPTFRSSITFNQSNLSRCEFYETSYQAANRSISATPKKRDIDSIQATPTKDRLMDSQVLTRQKSLEPGRLKEPMHDPITQLANEIKYQSKKKMCNRRNLSNIPMELNSDLQKYYQDALRRTAMTELASMAQSPEKLSRNQLGEKKTSQFNSRNRMNQGKSNTLNAEETGLALRQMTFDNRDYKSPEKQEFPEAEKDKLNKTICFTEPPPTFRNRNDVNFTPHKGSEEDIQKSLVTSPFGLTHSGFKGVFISLPGLEDSLNESTLSRKDLNRTGSSAKSHMRALSLCNQNENCTNCVNDTIVEENIEKKRREKEEEKFESEMRKKMISQLDEMEKAEQYNKMLTLKKIELDARQVVENKRNEELEKRRNKKLYESICGNIVNSMTGDIMRSSHTYKEERRSQTRSKVADMVLQRKNERENDRTVLQSSESNCLSVGEIDHELRKQHIQANGLVVASQIEEKVQRQAEENQREAYEKRVFNEKVRAQIERQEQRQLAEKENNYRAKLVEMEAVRIAQRQKKAAEIMNKEKETIEINRMAMRDNEAIRKQSKAKRSANKQLSMYLTSQADQTKLLRSAENKNIKTFNIEDPSIAAMKDGASNYYFCASNKKNNSSNTNPLNNYFSTQKIRTNTGGNDSFAKLRAVKNCNNCNSPRINK